jgi:hypothetical protein
VPGRAVADDYGWFHDRYGDLETCCFTLVKDLSPEQLLAALKIEPRLRITGVDGLRQPSQREMIEHDRLLVGAAPVGRWTLMVEVGGFVGSIDEAMRPVSKGRTVVSNQRGISGACCFSWWRDGALRLQFDHAFADERDGTHPDDVLTDMVESGYDVSGDDDADLDHAQQFAAGLALSERITGVPLTPAVLESADFAAGPARWQDY